MNESEIYIEVARNLAFQLEWQSGKYRDVEIARRAADRKVAYEIARARRKAGRGGA